MVEAQTAVVSVVEAGSQEVLRQVHFTMEVDGATQEQQVRAPTFRSSVCLAVAPIIIRRLIFCLNQVVVDQSQADALAAAAAAGDSLICQAIINSGIALGTEETVVEEVSQTTEEMNKEDSDPTDVDQGVVEIQVKEELDAMEEVHRSYLFVQKKSH